MTDSLAGELLVVDLPADTTPEQAEELLDAPYRQGFYLFSLMPWHRGARGVYKRRVAPGETAQTKEAQAIQFIRTNREMSISQLYAALKAMRFVRSVKWITDKRRDIVDAERRIKPGKH